MPFIKYEGAQLYYVDVDRREDKSKGLTMLLIHGAGTSHSIWDAQIKELSSRYRVVAPDLSAHGRSEIRPGSADINGYVEEVAALVEHLDLQDFVLGGHSMGGGVVLAYALNEQLRQPRALLLVSTNSNLDMSHVIPGLAVEVIERIIRRLTGSPRGMTGQGVLGSGDLHDSMRNLQRDLEACHRFDVTDHLSRIQLPVFAIVGDDDEIFPPPVMKRLTDGLPMADIAVVIEADHCPMTEQPTEFNRLVGEFLDWLERVGQRSSL